MLLFAQGQGNDISAAVPWQLAKEIKDYLLCSHGNINDTCIFPVDQESEGVSVYWL